MKVLALLGSPRKKGNTESLLRAVLEGVVAGGGSPELVRLCDLHIDPCIGCGGCAKTGRCVLADDMQVLYPKIGEADRVILASPIYFYGITAQAKAFVDRCQAMWSAKHLCLEKGEWRPDPKRKGFLVAVAATQGARVFEGAILTARYAFDAMGLAYGGEFAVKGFDGPKEVARDMTTLARAREAGGKFMAD
jgi:multimeric flavodoxin WrbA